MAEITYKVEGLNIDAANNGVIIAWCEKTKRANAGKFDNDQWDYSYKKEVFDEDDIEKAFARFKELWMKYYEDKKSSESSLSELKQGY